MLYWLMPCINPVSILLIPGKFLPIDNVKFSQILTILLDNRLIIHIIHILLFLFLSLFLN